MTGDAKIDFVTWEIMAGVTKGFSPLCCLACLSTISTACLLL